MDRIVTATEANQRFSELLGDVSAGESFTITSRGKPVAAIVPITVKPRPTEEQMAAFWRKMDRYPTVISGPWTRDELYER